VERLVISLAILAPTLSLAGLAGAAYLFLPDVHVAQVLAVAAIAFVWVMLVLVVPALRLLHDKQFWETTKQHIHGAWWLIAYLPTIALISYFGSAKFGGLDLIKYGWDLVVVAVVGLGFYVWGLRCGWRTPDVAALGETSDRV
jgi:hypothetical protein